MNYRGHEIRLRVWPTTEIKHPSGVVRLVKAHEGETMEEAAKAYIDFQYDLAADQDEIDRKAEAAKENYEEYADWKEGSWSRGSYGGTSSDE